MACKCKNAGIQGRTQTFERKWGINKFQNKKGTIP